MKNQITDFYKENFIKAVIDVNKKLYFYIHNNLKKNDIQYSDTLGYGGDNSLNIDLYAEELFIKYLKDFGNIYSEECGIKIFDKEFTIIIDPIDGSNNFYSNLEYYGSSVALQYEDEIIAGFVCNLATGKMIYRAFDSQVVEISFENRVFFSQDKQKLAIFERAYDYPFFCKELSSLNIKFRSLGATALSLANSRNYLFVLHKGNIRNFDICAALYICKDLYIYRDDDTVLISINKDVFRQVKERIGYKSK